ncbi:MAG: hypothetical protein R6V07_17785 [Armatimonadota bacterium]
MDRFLPRFQYPYALNPDRPMTHGALGPPDIYSEAKLAQEVALRESMSVILRTWDEFANIFDRKYRPVEEYRTEGAETLLLTMGSYTETAKMVIDERRDKGEAVGLISVRLWRPFPFEELRRAVQDARLLIVFDRCISFGMWRPVFSEARSALYDQDRRPKVVGFIGGLGGRDVPEREFGYLIDRGRAVAAKGSDKMIETVGIR